MPLILLDLLDHVDSNHVLVDPIWPWTDGIFRPIANAQFVHYREVQEVLPRDIGALFKEAWDECLFHNTLAFDTICHNGGLLIVSVAISTTLRRRWSRMFLASEVVRRPFPFFRVPCSSVPIAGMVIPDEMTPGALQVEGNQ